LNNTGDKPQINAIMNAKYVGGGGTAVPPLPPHAVGIDISALLLKTIINIRYEKNKNYNYYKFN
jgi:hypothetical protein